MAFTLSNYKWVILWSDLLIFFLVFIIGRFLLGLNNSYENNNKLHQVFTTKLGMITSIIILAYVIIALLDSIHYKKALPKINHTDTVYYSHETYSMFDYMLGNMATNNEKTYSAPFALRSWVKENSHNKKREYPSLKHAGQHLKYDTNVIIDIILQSIWGLIKGFLISLILICLHRVWLLKNNYDINKSTIPWKHTWFTIASIIMFFYWIVSVGNLYHILGTNMSGRDTAYLALKGIRTAVLIGSLSTLISIPIAVILGILAGYFKGWVNDIIQYIYTVIMAIPGILLIAASISLFQVWVNIHPDYFNSGLEKADIKFLGLCFIFGITSWTALCRIIRADTLKISQLGYVQAAKVFGASHIKIIKNHILPNLSHLILITVVMEFSSFILAEVILSYIGIGIDSHMVSWGNMINLARGELSREPTIWWNIVGVFFLMFILILSTNLLSDLINKTFNPKTHLEK